VIDEWDDPVPADNEILIDVKAAGLNFADVLIEYQVRTPPPFIPGNEASGVVSAVGSKVTRFKIGDHIIGALRGGAFAEKAVVEENLAVPLPEGLSFAQGAAYSVAYGTSYHGRAPGCSPAKRYWFSAPPEASATRRWSWPRQWVQRLSRRPAAARNSRSPGKPGPILRSTTHQRRSSKP
jgi:D-arabinose 1-dehydrogenase-like Zn-dependent alcohol dehydrogenase